MKKVIASIASGIAFAVATASTKTHKLGIGDIKRP